LPNWDISRGFLDVSITSEHSGNIHTNTLIFCVVFFILFAGRICGAAMGRTGVRGHNKINMTIRELYYTLSRIFPKLEFIAGISIFNIHSFP
jgi:hypothetical protein